MEGGGAGGGRGEGPEEDPELYRGVIFCFCLLKGFFTHGLCVCV